MFQPDNSPVPTTFSVLDQYQVSHFEGQLLTEIEKIGLPDKQESALKSGIKQLIWQLYAKGFASAEIDSFMAKLLRPIQ